MAWEEDLGLDAIRRRIGGEVDSRGRVAINSRGQNVYNGGSNAAVVGKMNSYNPNASQFDARFGGRARDILGRRSQIVSDEEYQKRRINEGFNSSLDEFDRVRQLALTNNTERMANQGILRSGINVAEQGKIGDVYQRGVDEASSSRARNLEDVARSILGAYQGAENDWQNLEEEDASWKAEQARIRAEEEARRIAQERALEEQRRAIEAEIARAQPRPDPTGQYRPAPVARQAAAPAPRPSGGSSGGGGGSSSGGGGGSYRSYSTSRPAPRPTQQYRGTTTSRPPTPSKPVVQYGKAPTPTKNYRRYA